MVWDYKLPLPAGCLQLGAQELPDCLELGRQRDRAQAEASSEAVRVPMTAPRPEEQHSSARHQSRPDKARRTRGLVVTIDERETRSHAEQCVARGFPVARERRIEPGQLDGGADERCTEGVLR